MIYKFNMIFYLKKKPSHKFEKLLFVHRIWTDNRLIKNQLLYQIELVCKLCGRGATTFLFFFEKYFFWKSKKTTQVWKASIWLCSTNWAISPFLFFYGGDSRTRTYDTSVWNDVCKLCMLGCSFLLFENVAEVGFEPTASRLWDWRANQTALFRNLFCVVKISLCKSSKLLIHTQDLNLQSQKPEFCV